MFYSKSIGGFYSEDVHGSHTLTIIDPSWCWPQVEVIDPAFDPAEHPIGTPVPMVLINDPTVTPPTVTMPNPACKIPADAVEITEAEHVALLEEQSTGKIIDADMDGRPVAVNPPPLPMADAIAGALKEIDATAGEARGRYITIAPGQEATYLIKASQAATYAAAGYTGAVPGLVQAEVDATGSTAQQATDAILAQQAAWEYKAAQIESARRRGKVTVAAAATNAAAELARDAAIAELRAL